MMSSTLLVVPPSSPRLLDQVRERIRVEHYSLRTEQAYVGWIKRYILFHDKRHPRDMGKVEVEAFLSALAVERNVSAATQTQALSALLFLYREVLGVELPWLDDLVRAKKPRRLPSVLTRAEMSIHAHRPTPALRPTPRVLHQSHGPTAMPIRSPLSAHRRRRSMKLIISCLGSMAENARLRGLGGQ